ncbi:MAG TPA: energy transducer TonB [Polyangiaceae bacterium]|nr:energy transducer TonB [Polyangiaceae bacterium]
MKRSALYTFSLVAHGVVALVLGAIEVHKAHTATAIEIADVKPKQDKPSEPPKPPEALPPKPTAPARRSSAPRPASAAPATPQVNANPSFADVPDFGLALEGGVSAGGIPVSVNQGPPVQPAPPAPRRQLTALKPIARKPCAASSKPRPLSVPQPAYPDVGAHEALDGKVRVRLTIDELGQVVDVQLLQRLGPKFDQAALEAVRTARFEPATECGRATRGTFTVALRFSAG